MSRGRTPHQPTQQQRELVESLAACGIEQENIARVLKMDPKTLRLHYADELDLGGIKANGKVAGALFKTASTPGTQGHVPAAIFWLKARAGWSEYAPPPREPPGKKELAQQASNSAGEGNEWGDLIH